MGNCQSCNKCCRSLCPDEEEESIKPANSTENLYKSIYDYPSCYVNDIKLQRGDILEVIAENEHWFFVRKRNVAGVEEKGNVPKDFVRPTRSLEANPWYFDNIKKRLDAKRCLLRPENLDGAFLVWRSTENNCFYLSVRNGPYARHYPIKESELDNQFYLTESKTFNTIPALVKSYSKDPGGLCARLNNPCVMLDRPPIPSLSPDIKWEVNKSSLTKLKKLGSGEFGEVWHGRWNNVKDVAIKEFRVISPAIQTEINVMKELKHEHLLKLYAVCTADEPFCIITELMENGSLKKYLISHKKKQNIDFSCMMDFAVQITDGMAYLESKQIVHRDLRADNILLTKMLFCKIADFGLSQFTFSQEEEISMAVKVPVKWMAPEIFANKKYTSKCDVWSFGILLTEIITYGDDPYPGKDNAACIHAIRNGYRMECPPKCPQDLYDIMLLCWKANPDERPEFTKLQEMLMAMIPEPITELK